MKSTLDGLAERDLLDASTDNASHVVAQRAEKSQVLDLVECFVLLAWVELGGYRLDAEVGPGVE